MRPHPSWLDLHCHNYLSHNHVPAPHHPLRSSVVGGIKRLPNGKIDYNQDFFSRPAYLTVSGQLQVGGGGASFSRSQSRAPPCFAHPALHQEPSNLLNSAASTLSYALTG